jgi:hypothetical protein
VKGIGKSQLHWQSPEIMSRNSLTYEAASNGRLPRSPIPRLPSPAKADDDGGVSSRRTTGGIAMRGMIDFAEGFQVAARA